MIEYIYGNLIVKESNYCIIDVNGIGYRINITNNKIPYPPEELP